MGLRNMYRLVLCIAMLSVTINLTAQFETLSQSSQWFKGTVTVKNNDLRKGFIQRNDKLGLIKFKSDLDHDESNVESFQEKSILALEYFDTDLNSLRSFYSFNCESDQTGFNGYFLFEVLKDLKSFAILSRKTKMELVGKKNSGMEAYSNAAGLIMSQKEGFFCVDESGKLEYFLIVENIEENRIMRDKSKVKTKYKEEIIKKYLGGYWPEIKNYAKDNSLSFSRKDDIIPLLNYVEKVSKKY